MCHAHYERWRKGARGEELEAPVCRTSERDVCDAEDCQRIGGWSGWCKKHYQKWRRDRQLFMLVAAMGGKCKMCGEQKHPCQLDFHHRDPEEKESEVARLLSGSWDTLVEEARKCDLVCRNCHAQHHWNYNRLVR